MPYYEKAKDIFIQRKASGDGFEEHPLIVQPNSVIITDSVNNLVMITTSSLLAGTGSVEHALSSSYSQTSSFALNGGGSNISASWASGSLYSTTSDFALDSTYCLSASMSNSASYVSHIGITTGSTAPLSINGYLQISVSGSIKWLPYYA